MYQCVLWSADWILPKLEDRSVGHMPIESIHKLNIDGLQSCANELLQRVMLLSHVAMVGVEHGPGADEAWRYELGNNR